MPGRRNSKPALEPGQRAEFFQPILAACQPIAELTSAFDAELAVSALLGGAYAAADSDRNEALAQFVDDLLAVLAERSDALAGALLAGLAGVAPPAQAARAAEALAGAEAPAWVDQVGRVRSTGCWAMRDIFGDQTEYILTFEYVDQERGGPAHAVCVLVDHNLDLVKDCWISLQPDGILADCRRSTGTDPDLVLTEADPAIARAVTGQLFGNTDELPELPESEQLGEVRATVLARLAALPADGKLPEPLGPDERLAAITEFLAAPEAKIDGPDDETMSACVELVVDYAADRRDGDVLRWSPIAVEIFLIDWAPRSAVIDEECVRWLPVVLDAYVGYAGRRSELPDRSVAAIRAAVTRFTGDFAELMATGAGADQDTAAQVARQMLADGVDPTDQQAMRAWLDAHFSAR